MTLLHQSVEAKKMDVRLVERNISRGVLSRAEYETALKAIPDDAENADWISLESLSDDGEEVEISNGKGSH